MMNNSSSPSSFKHESSQRFAVDDPNTSASMSMEISKLGIPDEVNELAIRIKPFHDQIQQFKTNFENGTSRSENEAQCVRFCDYLLQEHIKSLDRYNSCLGENNSLNERLDELNHRVKELERLLWLEKESKNDLKKKFEDDEQQNQDESKQQQRLIEDLKNRLKSAEKDKKKLYDEKQELLFQYQTDLTASEKERTQLKLLNKKLIKERELDELQSLNNQNAATNLANELCALLNQASGYRRKGAFFGRQFMATFDMVFGRFKPNRSNVTFLDMQTTSEDLNRSVLSLDDITHDELCNFNIILKENLVQNEDEISLQEDTFINSSKLLGLSGNLANCTMLSSSFENRLLGNETFKLTSLNEFANNTQLPAATCDLVAQDILDELLAEETRHLIIKTLLELNKSNQVQNAVYKDQIQFMFKPDSLLQEESFEEELYNRFEESFSKNYARNCAAIRNVSGSGHELLKNILENDGDSIRPEQSQIGSTMRSDDALSVTECSNCGESNTGDQMNDRQAAGKQSLPLNVTTVIKRVASKDNFSMIANSNDTQQKQSDLFEERDLSAHLMPPPKAWPNSTNLSELSKTATFSRSRLSSQCSSLSNSGSEISSSPTEPLIVTVNKRSRSDGESPNDYSSSDSHGNEADTDTDSNMMHLTSVNNLSSAFTELSGNQKLNSTVRTNDEKSREPHSTLSSNMRLSDDELEPVDEQKPSDEEPNESDPFFIDAMLSKDQQLNDLHGFYSTIRHDSNHSVANMELSGSTQQNETKSSISLSTLIDKFDDQDKHDEYALKEDTPIRSASHRSHSKCRIRRR